MHFKKIIKWIFWTIISIVCLLLLLTYLVQLPVIQNKIKDYAVTYLENKINTEVALDRFYVNFPNEVEIEGLFLRDENKDTLVYAKSLKVSIYLLDLLNNKANFSAIEANDLVGRISRDKKGDFNFDYIIDAFASNDTIQKKSTSDFSINLKKVDLKKINVAYHDSLDGYFIDVKFADFTTEFKKFNLNDLLFEIPNIKLDGLQAQVKLLENTNSQNQTKAVVTATDTKLPKLKIGIIDWNNFNVLYTDYNSDINVATTFKNLQSEIKKIDLEKLDFEVDFFDLDQASINLELLANNDKKKQVEVATSELNTSPQFKLNQLNLNKVALNYSNLNEKKALKGLDYNYLSFSEIDVKAKNIAYTNQAILANILSGFFNEKSGLLIQEFSSLLAYKANAIQVSNFKLKTPKSFINNQTELRYRTIDDLSKNLGNVKVDAEFIKSKLAISDLLLLAPALANQEIIKNNATAVLYLDTKVSGTVNNLLVSRLNFSGFGATSVQASGQVKNVLDPEVAFVDLRVKELKTTRKDIFQFLPKNALPATISLPENILITGGVLGSPNDFKTKLTLNSTYGLVQIDAKLNQQEKSKEIFDLNANLEDFELGKLIKNDSIGKISIKVAANGKGFNPETMDANFTSSILSIEYNSYLYKDIEVLAQIKDKKYTADLCFIDPNADVQVTAQGKITNTYPTVNLIANVAKLNLQELNITTEPIAIETKLVANISDLNPNNANGKLRITDFKYITPEKTIPLDTIKVDMVSSSTVNNFYLHSQIIDATISGKYSLNTLPAMFYQTVSNYFNISDVDEEYITTENTFFNANAQIKNDRVLFSLLPNLETFETAKIFAWYKADANAFNVSMDLPNLIYATNNFSNIKLNAFTKDNTIDYNFSIENLQTSAYRIRNISLAGEASNDQLNYLFTIKNKDFVDQYKIDGTLESLNNLFKMSLNSEGILLNYEPWHIAKDNKIEWNDQGFLAQNFSLFNESSNLVIESTENKFNAPLNITFKNFKIEDISHIIKKDSLAAKGLINGYVEFDDLKSDFDFIGDIGISNFEYNSAKIGDLSAKITKSENKEDYLGTISLLGSGNNVVINGTYNTVKNTFNVQAMIKALQMATIQGFSANQISKASGYVSGILFVQNIDSGLSILGQTKFNDVGFTINTLNTTLKNIDKSIVFNKEGIAFNDFEMNDIENNKLTLDGKVYTQNYQKFKFDLNLDSKNFSVMNSTEKDNDLFYGKMYVDINMSIKGTSLLPLVNGKISINKDTDFTFVLPNNDPSIAEREGIVEFVDTNDFIFNLKDESDTHLSQSNIKGLNLNTAITINKEATLNIIVDKQHGDKLILNGAAQLVGGVDPSGGTTLTGTYEIDSGSYDMTFNFIKRKFDIKKGSYIIWTGEPTSAIANITAIYKTNVAPIDLMSSQIQGMSQSEQNLYKQRIPVETLLQLNGELLKPTLSFNIELPANNYNISTEVYNQVEDKLKQMRNDESEMNKQVIALLILNRFIGTSSLASAAGGSASSIARQSVSNLVSEELNSIASHIVSGVDLNFDLDTTEDYSTGKKLNRTDLNVQVSKRLFDDRLKITVGSNFGLEGEERANEQSTNIAGDVSAEYMLTPDGRYMIRVYRKNTYQVAFQGQVVETGVGFIITMNYNTYKEYVQKNREAREERRIQKEQLKKNKAESTTI